MSNSLSVPIGFPHRISRYHVECLGHRAIRFSMHGVHFHVKKVSIYRVFASTVDLFGPVEVDVLEFVRGGEWTAFDDSVARIAEFDRQHYSRRSAFHDGLLRSFMIAFIPD
ncbi:hypothetical protein Trydic_g5833 [Trypoxylus dichotomus]